MIAKATPSDNQTWRARKSTGPRVGRAVASKADGVCEESTYLIFERSVPLLRIKILKV